MSKLEKDNIIGSRLDFFVFCDLDIKKETLFKIFLNDYLVRSEYLDCDGTNKILAINRDFFKEGSNSLTFAIDSGKFILSEIKLVNVYVGNINPTYSFDVSDSIMEESDKIILKMEFIGSGSKKANIKINDNSLDMDTSSKEFEIDILNYLEIGQNFIEINPENSFEIKRLIIKTE
jgi:hypothetical protein